jgi:hypothetical protein
LRVSAGPRLWWPGAPAQLPWVRMSQPSRASDPSPGATPTISPDVTVDPTTDGGDHDRFAHICRKEDVTRAYITGEAIEALCGKKWVPTRDPDRYPVCPSCKEALTRIQQAGSN